MVSPISVCPKLFKFMLVPFLLVMVSPHYLWAFCVFVCVFVCPRLLSVTWFHDIHVHSMEDDLPSKTTYHGRRPTMVDDLQWKTTFDGRRPSMEDDLQWKTPFDGRQPAMEDKPWWKTTFDRSIIYYLKTMLKTPHSGNNISHGERSVPYYASTLVHKRRHF